jgi:adenylate cyclase
VYFFRGELDAFFAEAERAIDLNPNHAANLAGLGTRLSYAGDERGIALVKKAIALDPFHPMWFYLPIARHHFERGEHQEAFAAMRNVSMPDYYRAHLFRAAICAELGRDREARSALENLLGLSPEFTIETLIEEWRKWNATDDSIRRWVTALRKAGLPEGTEA